MTKIAATCDVLRTAAKAAGIQVKARYRKAELEEAVLNRPEGRKSVYRLLEDEMAPAIVDDVLKKGSYFLPRPNPDTITVEGTFDSLPELYKAKRKAYLKAHAHYVGMVQALKRNIRERELRNIRWEEEHDGPGFYLGVRR